MVITVREKVFAAASERVQFPQQRPPLARQENVMVDLARVDFALPHFHALPGDYPFFIDEVDFAPRRFRQFAGADKHQQHQAREYPRRGRHVDFVLCQDAEEFRQFVRRDRRVMSSWRWPQCAAQAGHRVVFGHARGDGVAEYLPAYLRLPSRHLDRTAPFDLPEHVENDGCLEFLDRVLADQGEHIFFQPVQGIGGRPGLPRVDLVLVPFAGDGLERVGGLDRLLPLFDAPGLRRVDAGIDLGASGRSRFPGVGQGNFRVLAKRKQSLDAAETITHAPIFRAVRVDQQIQAAAIGQLVGLVLALGHAWLDVGEWRGEFGQGLFSLDLVAGCDQEGTQCGDLLRGQGHSIGSVFDDQAALVIHGQMEFARGWRGGLRLPALLPFQFDRVDSIANEPVCIDALLPRVRQRQVGIVAERNGTFLAAQMKAHAPALFTRRFYQQVEAVTVADPVLALPWHKRTNLLFSQGSGEFRHFAGISCG
jgi:hypothetical protein